MFSLASDEVLLFNFSCTMVAADTLSRTPVSLPTAKEEFQQEVCAFLDLVVNNLPATDTRLRDIQSHQDSDPACSQIKHFCQGGWPPRFHLKGPLKAYISVKDELSVHKGLLLRGNRLVIPPALRKEILAKIHSGHQGATKCRARASQAVSLVARFRQGAGRSHQQLSCVL